MAKKIDEAEVKKECPSCGLGVALDATICEFCGWDFQEEDEWILQIEKLERELMLEKQKFEPGTVDGKIESTLHSPTIERIEMKKAASSKAAAETRPAQKAPIVTPAREPSVMREAKPSEVRTQRAPLEAEAARAPERAPRTVRESPAEEPRRAPATRTLAAPEAESPAEAPKKKTRLVRKVKK